MYLDNITMIRLSADSQGVGLRPITPDSERPEVELSVGLAGVIDKDRIVWGDEKQATGEQDEAYVIGLLTVFFCETRRSQWPKEVEMHSDLRRWRIFVPPSVCDLNPTGSRWRRIYAEAIRRVDSGGCDDVSGKKILLADHLRSFVAKTARILSPSNLRKR
jgi:hypothetical protein